MKGNKLFYVFGCPMKSPDCKVGITGSPFVRLGTYQIAYSRNSHVACFDRVWYGPDKAIENLEKSIKIKYDWQIERDGRGASEWVDNISLDEIEKIVDQSIEGNRFKVEKIPKKYLPLTVDNLPEFLKDKQLIDDND